MWKESRISSRARRRNRSVKIPGVVRADVEAPPEDDPNRGGSPVGRGPMTSLVAEGLHYIRNGDGREELFDLDGDPGEIHDLASAPKYDTALKSFRERLRR